MSTVHSTALSDDNRAASPSVQAFTDDLILISSEGTMFPVSRTNMAAHSSTFAQIVAMCTAPPGTTPEIEMRIPAEMLKLVLAFCGSESAPVPVVDGRDLKQFYELARAFHLYGIGRGLDAIAGAFRHKLSVAPDKKLLVRQYLFAHKFRPADRPRAVAELLASGRPWEHLKASFETTFRLTGVADDGDFEALLAKRAGALAAKRDELRGAPERASAKRYRKKYTPAEFFAGLKAWEEGLECAIANEAREFRAKAEEGGKMGWLPWDELEGMFDELPTELK